MSSVVTRNNSSSSQLSFCSQCASLEDHPALKSIQESIHFGAHKNTPLVYLSPHELVESVRRKTSENRTLTLSVLNTSRTLMRNARTMKNSHCLIVALASHNIPRVRAILATAQRNGSGILGTLEMVERAASGLYRPRDYLEEEFHRILLFSKLGGGRVASIAQRSCFLPSACTAERKLKVQPLQSSPSYLTQQELHLNLSVVLPLPEFSTYGPEVPVVVCVDELKLEERL